MYKSNLFILLAVLVMSCQNKKADTTMETPPTPAEAPAPPSAEPAPAAAAAPAVDIWASELGAKLKADYKANPANQAEIDRNIILEYAVKNNMDVKHTPSGLYYVVEKEGNGKAPIPSNTVSIHYRGFFLDGREFDSSHKRNAPTELMVGQFVPGFAEGLTMMKPGGKLNLLIPSGLGYGPQGYPGAIPGNAVLRFELELLKIVK